MSLAQRAKEPPAPSKHGMPCSIGKLLVDLPPKEAQALRTILASPWRIWPHKAVEDALEAEGHRFGVGQVGKHRRGTCRCPKP